MSFHYSTLPLQTLNPKHLSNLSLALLLPISASTARSPTPLMMLGIAHNSTAVVTTAKAPSTTPSIVPSHTPTVNIPGLVALSPIATRMTKRCTALMSRRNSAMLTHRPTPKRTPVTLTTLTEKLPADKTTDVWKLQSSEEVMS